MDDGGDHHGHHRGGDRMGADLVADATSAPGRQPRLRAESHQRAHRPARASVQTRTGTRTRAAACRSDGQSPDNGTRTRPSASRLGRPGTPGPGRGRRIHRRREDCRDKSNRTLAETSDERSYTLGSRGEHPDRFRRGLATRMARNTSAGRADAAELRERTETNSERQLNGRCGASARRATSVRGGRQCSGRDAQCAVHPTGGPNA